jgi:HSP20 family protein
MDRAFGELFAPAAATTASVPLTDIVEEKTGWTLTLDLPGVQADAVDVTTEDRVLTVRFERPQPVLPEGAQRLTTERPTGRFERQFRLPRTADLEQVRATAEHGVLTLHIGKLSPAQPRRVPVTSDVASANAARVALEDTTSQQA